MTTFLFFCLLPFSLAADAGIARVPLKRGTRPFSDSISGGFSNGFTADLQFGSNNQTVELIVDLSRADSWVQSSSNAFCSEIGDYVNQTIRGYTLQVSGCKSNWLFNTSESTSLNPVNETFWHLAGGEYPIQADDWGYYAVDDVSVGGKRVSNLLFGVSNVTNFTGWKKFSKSTAKELNYINLTGPVWGLGSLSGMPKYSTITLMKDQGVISRNLFSVWIGPSSSNDSEIIIGGIDHSKYEGDLLTVPMINPFNNSAPSFFGFMLDGISVYQGNISMPIVHSSVDANIASGLTSEPIALPAGMLNAIVSSAGGMVNSTKLSHKQVLRNYYLPCDAEGGITFDISGAEVDVPFSEIIIPNSDSSSTYCATKFQESSSSFVTLGIPFMRSTYTVFDIDNLEISFAKPKTSSIKYSNDSVEVISSSTIPGAKKAPGYNQTTQSFGYDARSVNLSDSTSNSTAVFSAANIYNSASKAYPGLLFAILCCFI